MKESQDEISLDMEETEGASGTDKVSGLLDEWTFHPLSIRVQEEI